MGVYIDLSYYVKKNKQWEWIPHKEVEPGYYYILDNPNKLYPVYSLLNSVAEKRDTYPEDVDDNLKEMLTWDESEISMWGDFNNHWCYVKKLIEKFEEDGESNYEPCVKQYVDAIREDLLDKYPIDDLIAVWSYY